MADACRGQPAIPENVNSMSQMWQAALPGGCQTIQIIAKKVGSLVAGHDTILTKYLKSHCICQYII
jgi:hypothetical protein